MSNPIDHENIAGEHDSKQIDSQHIDIEEDGKPSVQRKRSSRVLLWILAGVTVISLIITALVQVNINSTVTAKDAVIATAHHARDVANAEALVIENQLASVGAEIQTAANTAATKIAADKAAAAAKAAADAEAAAAKQAAIYKGFTDKLEYAIVHNSTVTNPQGQPVNVTAASCTVISVDATGVGTYSCNVTFSDGSSQTNTVTLDANDNFSN